MTHPRFGKFASLEGFWYWLSTGRVHDQLRFLAGHKAKPLDKTLPKVHIDNFQKLIKQAIYLKLAQNPDLFTDFIESDLPFIHYYWYGIPDNCNIIMPQNLDWLIYYFEELRSEYADPG